MSSACLQCSLCRQLKRACNRALVCVKYKKNNYYCKSDVLLALTDDSCVEMTFFRSAGTLSELPSVSVLALFTIDLLPVVQICHQKLLFGHPQHE